jgi:hypothetical protein
VEDSNSCVRILIFIGVSARMCMSICVCTVGHTAKKILIFGSFSFIDFFVVFFFLFAYFRFLFLSVLLSFPLFLALLFHPCFVSVIRLM